MILYTLPKNKRNRVEDSAIKLHKLNTHQVNNHEASPKRLDYVIIIIATILFLPIMVFTKLCPCIETAWTQDFCNKWNDFWFSISASFISAILFYFIFTTIPNRIKRENIEILIDYELGSVIVHLNTLIALLTEKCFSPVIGKHDLFDETTKQQFVEELSKLDWEKKLPYLMDGSTPKNTIECIRLEIKSAQKKLEQVQIQYGHYFTIEEKNTFTKDILHNKLLTNIETVSDTELSDKKTKESIAEMLYSFYHSLFSFSAGFKRSGDYSW